MRVITRIIVHCTDTDWGTVDSIRQFHTVIRGWRDIGYHYLILNGRFAPDSPPDPALDGQVLPGRPLDLIGAHTIGHNHDSVGVCLVGRDRFTGAQLYEALPALLRELMTRHGLPVSRIFGHRDFACRACPNIDTGLLRWIAAAALHHDPPCTPYPSAKEIRP